MGLVYARFVNLLKCPKMSENPSTSNSAKFITKLRLVGIVCLLALLAFAVLSTTEQRFKMLASDDKEMVICDTKTGKMVKITYDDANDDVSVGFNPNTPDDGCEKDSSK